MSKRKRSTETGQDLSGLTGSDIDVQDEPVDKRRKRSSDVSIFFISVYFTVSHHILCACTDICFE